MAKLEIPAFKIKFSNNGTIICDSYIQGAGGISWTNGTIQGYSTNDLVKNIEEIQISKNENKQKISK